jgi:glutaredoxin-related protein
MKNNLYKYLFVIAVIFLGGVFFFSKNPKDNSSTNQVDNAINSQIELPANYELFWGDGCPHCKIVEDFLASWDKKDEIKVDQLEVWNNIDNAKKMQTAADYCNIPKNELGVPMLFTPDGKCLVGDGPIIDLFKSL